MYQISPSLLLRDLEAFGQLCFLNVYTSISTALSFSLPRSFGLTFLADERKKINRTRERETESASTMCLARSWQHGIRRARASNFKATLRSPTDTVLLSDFFFFLQIAGFLIEYRDSKLTVFILLPFELHSFVFSTSNTTDELQFCKISASEKLKKTLSN